jgi:hypothetical protein
VGEPQDQRDGSSALALAKPHKDEGIGRDHDYDAEYQSYQTHPIHGTDIPDTQDHATSLVSSFERLIAQTILKRLNSMPD